MDNHETFPCTMCGSCCKRVGKVLTQDQFPYKWDENGKCEMLEDDNSCRVYENRPLICNIESLRKLIGAEKQIFYQINIESCNRMMDEDGIPKYLRIK